MTRFCSDAANVVGTLDMVISKANRSLFPKSSGGSFVSFIKQEGQDAFLEVETTVDSELLQEKLEELKEEAKHIILTKYLKKGHLEQDPKSSKEAPAPGKRKVILED